MSKENVATLNTEQAAGVAMTVTNKGVLVSFAKEMVCLQKDANTTIIDHLRNKSVAVIEHAPRQEWFVCLHFDHDYFLEYARQINEAAQLLLSAMKQPAPESERNTAYFGDKKPPQDRGAEHDPAPAPQSHEGRLTSVSQASREKREEDFLAGVADIRRNNSY